MKGFIYALQLLTIIPVKIKDAVDERDLGKSTAFFPLVGAVQGVILVGANLLFSRFLPHDIASCLVLLILILTNGGFHLDGFADTIDGLAGGNTKEERLHIMKDSRIGAIGVVALILLLLTKFLAINSLQAEIKNYILFLLPVIGRWSMVPMAYWANYARPTGGLGRAFTEHTGLKQLLLASFFALLSSVIFMKQAGAAYFIVLFLSTYLTTLYFRKKLGGVTGDVFGFQSEITEVIFLILASISFNM
ncbi:MAG: adenosylcobinamide-GDP ribazoletransferase [Deltaproteobacteria bacterium]|nr:adenosylcobinamide-GDP ribazoletransferase [Deltaproteobacteria bacterium]